MTPTIHHFFEALSLPRVSFETLAAIRPELRGDASPAICRRTRFAEAEVTLDGAKHLLCCPLCSAAILSVESSAARLKYTQSRFLTSYRILRHEMRYTDATGHGHLCDVVLHSLPAGRPLSEALDEGVCGEEIAEELQRMQQEFLTLGFTHGSICAGNIYLTPAGRLVAVRYHHSRFGEGSDAEAFEALRRLVSEKSLGGVLHDLPAPTYRATQPDFSHHRRVGRMAEQLILVEDEAGYGFVDTSARTVIEPQFKWAEEFREGRAEVETASGCMGLIDKRGRYVIEPLYAIVDYDDRTGISRVRQGEQWALFDYEGQQLTDFAPREQTFAEGLNFATNKS